MPSIIAKPSRWLPGLRGDHPLARDLVGRWPFWEGQGDKLYDVANPWDIANHGTLTTMDPLTDWGVFDGVLALDLDGGNDYISLDAHVANFNTMGEGTIWAWFRTTNAGLQQLFAISDTSQASVDCMIYTNGGNVIWQTRGAVADLMTSPNTYDDGEWHCVVVTAQTGDRTRMYIDGIQTNDDGTIWFLSSPGGTLDALRIGNREDSGGNEFHWNGQIADVGVSSKIFAASEAQELYADPWGLITPRTKTYIFLPTAVVGSSWYYRAQEVAAA